MHRYELAVLKVLKERGEASLENIISGSGLGKDEVMWALENLKGSGMVEVDYSTKERVQLSAEGDEYAIEGLPEENLLKKAHSGKMKVADITDQKGRIGLQWAKKDGLIEITDGEIRLTKTGEGAARGGVADGETLRSISKGAYNHKDVANLVKRGLVSFDKVREIANVRITKKGEGASDEGAEDLIDSLDRNMMTNSSWQGKDFKKYDVKIPIERKIPAIKHPLKRLIDELKDAYISMGFQEVSGPAVESSFWNFDSLFMPQDHPARDMQDTLYISNPPTLDLGDVPYVNTVRKAHQKGWHSKWKEDVAKQTVLRTQATSVSSHFVYKIMNEMREDPERYQLPVKLFSIGRVFRNEAIDYRHLADFYQMDGVIIGKDLTLSNLFDTLKRIYQYMGVQIRFKPSYFPFVEPGAEYAAHFEKRDEWIELGGSGMLREEITGVKRSKLCALAWGAGIERLLLIKDPSLSSISELYGNNFGWLRKRMVV